MTSSSSCSTARAKPDPISAYLDEVRKDWEGSRHLFPKNSIPHFHWPIPFFGNPKLGEVATVGVNPSSSEFEPGRGWGKETAVRQWKVRLRDYFDYEVPARHWFSQRDRKLRREEFSYWDGTVIHMDLSYRPTVKVRTHPKADRAEFAQMIERDVAWMFRLLPLCPELRELRTVGNVVQRNGEISVKQFLIKQAPLYGYELQRMGDQPLLVHLQTGREYYLRVL